MKETLRQIAFDLVQRDRIQAFHDLHGFFFGPITFHDEVCKAAPDEWQRVMNAYAAGTFGHNAVPTTDGHATIPDAFKDPRRQ